MKKVIFLLFLFFAFSEVKAGCYLRLRLYYMRLRLYYKNNQPVLISFSGEPRTFYLDPTDSLVLYPDACGCGISLIKVFREDKEITTGKNPPNFNSGQKMICAPGNYSVHVLYQYAAEYIVQFRIVSNPVGVNDYEMDAGALALFPNPAQDHITISSEKEVLESISVFDLSSQLIKATGASGNSITLPLEDCPAGIYFVKVATINGRTSIRKLIVQ